MKCERCRLVEMVVEKVEADKIIHKCRKCGSEYKEKRQDENK